MIAKDSTSAVNFLVLDLDGFPATGQASNISATISINGAVATAISDTINEKGAGWYYFNHNFATAGNVFITFTASNCVIMPWEDDVINMAGSAPSAADIATAVWSYEDDNNFYHPYRTVHGAEGSNYSIYSLYGDGHDSGLVESIWGYDPSALIAATSAGKRLVDIQTNAARPGDAMTLTTAYNAAKTASQFNASTDTVTINSTQAATMTTATGFATPANITSAQSAIIAAMPSTTGLATSSDISTAQTAIINAMPSTTGLATGSDVSTAQAAIIAAMPDISGLSTFDPANDTVLIDSTQAATMVTATGFATASDISSAQSAIISAMPDVSGLSTFDPANDTVLIDSTQAASMVTATGFATPANVTAAQTAVINAMPDVSGLSTFDPANDTVLIDSAQAAGFATPTNITDAVSAIETYGDTNWSGGGGGGGGTGLTAEDVWKYSGTYGRTLTTSPTDISSLATQGDLTAAQTAIINAMPSTTGLATATNVSDAKADIIAAMPDVSGLSTFDPSTTDVNVSSASITSIQTGLAKTSELPSVPDIATGVWSDTSVYSGTTKGSKLSKIAFDVDDLPSKVWYADLSTYNIPTTAGYQIYTALNNCATSTDTAVLNAELQEILGGVMNWYVTANTLTVYSPSNTVIRTYAITRDGEGNIVKIQPNNQ